MRAKVSRRLPLAERRSGQANEAVAQVVFRTRNCLSNFFLSIRAFLNRAADSNDTLQVATSLF